MSFTLHARNQNKLRSTPYFHLSAWSVVLIWNSMRFRLSHRPCQSEPRSWFEQDHFRVGRIVTPGWIRLFSDWSKNWKYLSRRATNRPCKYNFHIFGNFLVFCGLLIILCVLISFWIVRWEKTFFCLSKRHLTTGQLLAWRFGWKSKLRMISQTVTRRSSPTCHWFLDVLSKLSDQLAFKVIKIQLSSCRWVIPKTVPCPFCRFQHTWRRHGWGYCWTRWTHVVNKPDS